MTNQKFNINKGTPVYMSINDTVKTLGIAERTLRKWIWEDKIPYININGNKYMIDVPQTLEMLRNGEVK